MPNIDAYTTIQMPMYVKKVTVFALKIHSVSQKLDLMLDSKDEDYAFIWPEENGYGPIHVSADWYFRNAPRAGEYYVVDDGEATIMSAEMFEKFYSRS